MKENTQTPRSLDALVRYELLGEYDGYIGESQDGDYVKFDDVVTLLSNANCEPQGSGKDNV